ncbi:MAG: 2Fe-2S iron-sulfur cluster-binding protein, partial [Alphaproteobacteria bacterium]
MTQKNRLNNAGRINRKKPVNFKYDGKSYTGYEGDTLASALLANDVHLVGRSFKYHRPRGIMTASVEEPNGLVQLEKGEYGEPNSRTTQTELYDGLTAKSQNCFPSVKYDIGGLNQLIAKFIPSGFYYKTFMPNMKAWMFFEKIIRRAAGLGKSTELPDPEQYARKTVYCDVLIAGGGPAGLVSALNAGKTGARVILMDEQNEMGGWGLTSPNMEIDGKKASVWIADMLSQLNKLKNVEVVSRATVIGYFDYNFLTAVERITDHISIDQRDKEIPRQRFWRIRAKQVILAQGALERPMLFANNDRPGVMMASAIRTYMNRYGVMPGNNIVFTTNNDTAYFTAIEASKNGANVTIVDIRKDLKSDLLKQAENQGIKVYTNSAIVDVKGSHRVSGVEVMELADDGKTCVGSVTKITADLVGMSSGWTPTVHLFSQARGKLKWDEKLTMFLPDTCQQDVQCVGACNGTMDMTTTLNESASAGVNAGKLSGNKSVSATKHKAQSHKEAPMR